MPTYRLVYQHRSSTDALTLTIEGRRPCDARDMGRNDLNARGLDAVDWPLLSVTLVETT